MKNYLLWTWRHYQLDVEECGTLQEAAEAAEVISDCGTGAHSHVEHWTGIEWEVVPEAEVDAIRNEISKQWLTKYKARTTPTHRIELQSLYDPDQWATVKLIYDGEPGPATGEAQARYGAGRVRVLTTRTSGRQ